jgi:coiled-coil and C2 domain-containing protein 2A
MACWQVDVPPVLFGYVSDNGRPASLALYLTLKPRLAPPAAELPGESFIPGEQGDVTRHARK